MKKVTVHYRDFYGRDATDSISITASRMDCINTDYLIITGSDDCKYYFNKEYVIYFTEENENE